MILMANKKNKDRHLVNKMTIRLGPPAKAVLEEIKDKEDRTYTAILTRALKLYAKENGFAWPSGS